MVILFISAAGLGIAFCAPPGAVTAEALRRGFDRGFWPVLLLELGSLIGDATWAVIALIGAAFLVQNMVVRLILSVAGILFLSRLVSSALKDAWLGTMPQAKTEFSLHGDFASGALLSLVNPYAVAFWLGLGGAMVTVNVTNPRPFDFVIYFAGFMLGALLWCFCIAMLIAYGKGFLTASAWGGNEISPALFRWINLICGMALIYFELRLCLSTLRLLLP